MRRTDTRARGARAWNPYYVAYAAAHGCTPEEMWDQTRGQRLRNIDFMQWISRRWAEWDALHGHGPRHGRSEAEYAAFGAWLGTRVESAAPAAREDLVHA